MVNKLYFYCLALFVAPTFSAFGQTQPSQDENGYYLIESAEHLKWFRDQVNASEHEQVDTNMSLLVRWRGIGGECFRARTSGHQR